MPGHTRGRSVLLGAVAGLVGGLAMTTLMLVLRSVAGVPTTVELLGDRIAALIPVDTFLWLLGVFGGYNSFKQLGIAAALLGQLGLAVVGGIALALLSRKEIAGTDTDPFLGIGRRTVLTVAALTGGAWVLVLVTCSQTSARTTSASRRVSRRSSTASAWGSCSRSSPQ